MLAFITNGERNRVDLDARRLELSQIFNWYADDFGGADNITRYVSRYHAADVSEFSVEFLRYSWVLNASHR